MSPKESRPAFNWVLCSRLALEMAGFRALPGTGWKLMEWTFCSKCSCPSLREVWDCVCVLRMSVRLGCDVCCSLSFWFQMKDEVSTPSDMQELDFHSCVGGCCLCVIFLEGSSCPWKLASHVFCFGILAIDSTSRLPSKEALILLVVLLRPCSFLPSCVLAHGDYNTGMSSPKSQTALTAHRCHKKLDVSLLPGTIFSPPWTQQIYFQVYAGHVVDEPPPPAPIQVATTTCECSFASSVSDIWSQVSVM